MKRNCLFFLLLTFAIVTHSQAQDGQIVIRQDHRIDSLVHLYKEANKAAGFYTIQVGFGSYDMAEELLEEVRIDFPEWYSKIIFDSPTYRVHVGKFHTQLEAERHFREVRKKYPGSLLLKP